MRVRVSVVLMVFCAASAAFALAGCGVQGKPAVVRAGTARVRVSGSGSCLPLLRLLAAGSPGGQAACVFLPGLHSVGGIQGVEQGTLDVGAISRGLAADEQTAGLKVTWLSNDGLVMAVNPSVAALGIRGITSQQVRDIYAGRSTDWRQLGASKSLPIVVLDRREDESAKSVLRDHILGPAGRFTVTDRAVVLYYESDMADALSDTTGAVGYLSLGLAVSQDIPVGLLTLDGVEASVGTVRSGTYTLVRPLGVVTKASAPVAVDEFLAWATSAEARSLMAEKGYAPYPE